MEVIRGLWVLGGCTSVTVCKTRRSVHQLWAGIEDTGLNSLPQGDP